MCMWCAYASVQVEVARAQGITADTVPASSAQIVVTDL
jgi:hypothetical protein